MAVCLVREPEVGRTCCHFMIAPHMNARCIMATHFNSGNGGCIFSIFLFVRVVGFINFILLFIDVF